MSTMRMKIAEQCMLSQRVSATDTVHKVDMTRWRKCAIVIRRLQARYGISLTYLPFVARATVEACALIRCSMLPSKGNNIIYTTKSISECGGLENGLIVPVIRTPTRRTARLAAGDCRSGGARASSSSPMKCRAAHFQLPFRQLRQRVRYALINTAGGHSRRGHCGEDARGD